MENPKIFLLGKKALLFAFLVIGINLVLTVVYKKFGESKNELFLTDKRLKNHKDHINYLVLGHSRAKRGIDEKIVQGAFNFASYGESNIYTYYKLKSILDHGISDFDNVILPIGFVSFFSSSNPYLVDQNYWKHHVNYFELGAKKKELSKYFQVSAQAYVTPYARWINRTINNMVPIFSRSRKQFSKLNSDSLKFQMVLESFEGNKTDREYYSPIAMDYFVRTLDLCAKNKKKVILIRYPVTYQYNKAYKVFIEENKINDAVVDSILQTRKESFVILDYEDLFFENENYFSDAHHLNSKGKEVFSRIFNNQLKQLEK